MHGLLDYECVVKKNFEVIVVSDTFMCGAMYTSYFKADSFDSASDNNTKVRDNRLSRKGNIAPSGV